jgi:HSP20 family protein
MVKSARVIGIERLEIVQLRDQVQRLLATLQEAADADVPPAPGEWCPPFDLCETPSDVLIFVELPGIEPAAIELSVTGEHLRISGEKRCVPRKGVVSHLCTERSFGHFDRRISLRWPIRVHEATAELRAGVLTVRLPRMHDRRGEEFKVPIRVVGDD